MTTALLVVGYVMAIPVCVRLVPVLREQRTVWFAVLQLGTAAIVVGHALQGRTGAAVVNSAFFVLFAIGWFCWPRGGGAEGVAENV